MYKKLNLAVSSSILAGLFLAGCSQQQISGGSQQTAGGQQVHSNSSLGSHANAASYAVDTQTAPIIKPTMPTGFDHQVQDVVVPKTPDVHHHDVQPTQVRQYMEKPIQKRVKPIQRQMAKPIQRQSVAHTQYSSGMPPAKPGQCYAKVRTGPTFTNAVKRVQVSPAINKRVLVRGPQYSHINKRVMVRPATHTYRYIPAQYKNVSKRVLVKPAHYTWQKGKKGPVTRIDNMTGEILCRVKIPAVYRTVVQKVMVRAGQRVKRHIPAVYQNVKERRLSSPAQYRNVHQPARFVNKTYKVKHGGTGFKWQPINC